MSRIPTIEDYLKIPAHPYRQTGGCRSIIKRKAVSGEPLVTVITIVLNRKEALALTVLSVLNQSYSNIEYIIIDGASNDGTVEVIKQFDSKIDLWLSEPDNGTSDAFNKGVSVAEGDFIFWLAADDWIEPDFIEIAVKAFLSSNADFVFGNTVMYEDESPVIAYNGDQDYAKTLMSGYPGFNFPALVIRKESFLKIGLLDTTYEFGNDYEWLLRLHLSGGEGYYENLLTVNRRAGGKGDSHLFESVLGQLRITRQYKLPVAKAMAFHFCYLLYRGVEYFVKLIFPGVIYKKFRSITRRRK